MLLVSALSSAKRFACFALTVLYSVMLRDIRDSDTLHC